MIRTPIIAALILYVSFLLYLTLGNVLGRGSEGRTGTSLTPFKGMARSAWHGGREFWLNDVGNVAVFMPIGAAVLALAPKRGTIRQAALAGFALSALIECLQYASGRGVLDVDDLILNTLGAVLGFYAADVLRRRLTRRRQT
ncbi:VanZ family protein [Paludisphaera rhizosphaerae]|uniref:VanZ family protein n=1 Tax=Paludisphaera rhizosphaerae TaxID=2711216 RepID=UPI0013E9CA20|nr:VanZ family protein [Paludisphaera rhizosphaerae]